MKRLTGALAGVIALGGGLLLHPGTAVAQIDYGEGLYDVYGSYDGAYDDEYGDDWYYDSYGFGEGEDIGVGDDASFGAGEMEEESYYDRYDAYDSENDLFDWEENGLF